jgi:hypothetical protein
MSTDTAIDVELAHRVRVQTDQRVRGLGSRAVCSCGWASGWLPSSDGATQAWAEHLDTAIVPPDALDQAMNVMLDLQDDLANAVVWLAENWSADLPAPGVHGGVGCLYTPDVPGVRLVALCGTADELGRVATRLGSPVPDGGPFDVAVRDFGRVRIAAWVEPSGSETAP